MRTLMEKIATLTKQLQYNKRVIEVYQARWVWYHTILAAELFILIIIELLILSKL